MTELRTENIFYPTLVSFIGALQLARFTRRVGEARGKYKVYFSWYLFMFVAVSLSMTVILLLHFAAIERQNTLEFYPIFLTLLWISSVFFHPAISSVFGLIYLYARYKYFYGYAEAGEKRLPGLRMAINILFILLIFCILGLAATGYTKYTGRTIDVEFYEEKAIEYTKPAVDQIKSSYNHLTKTLLPYLTTAKNDISDFLQYSKTLMTDFFSSIKSQYFSSYFQGSTQTKKEL